MKRFIKLGTLFSTIFLLNTFSAQVFSTEALYSLDKNISAHNETAIQLDFSKIKQLENNSAVDMLMPDGTSFSGVVAKTIRTASQPDDPDFKDSIRTIISFTDGSGAVELLEAEDRIVSILLISTATDTVYRAEIDTNGQGILKEQDANKYYCAGFPLSSSTIDPSKKIAAIRDTPTLTSLQNLESHSGATNTLYLNFWGGTLTNTIWNGFYNGTQPIDSTISKGADLPIGSNEIGILAAGASSAKSTSALAPGTPGTYWIGACVDIVTSESNTSNNCSTGIQVTVASAPDLIVESPAVNSRVHTPGESFTLSAKIKNQGSGSSSPTTLRYYRSITPTISSSAIELATDSITSLAEGTTSSRQFESVVTADIPGTYWVGACVDSVTGESDISNNCSTSVEITVSGVDLITQFPGVDDPTLASGERFTASATVRNQGNQTSTNTTLRYYSSGDSTISTSDKEIGNVSIATLAEGGISPQTSTLIAPGAAGTYWVGACVDGVSGEFETDNNCSSGIEIMVDTSFVDGCSASTTDNVSAVIDNHTFSSNDKCSASTSITAPLATGSSGSVVINNGINVDFIAPLVILHSGLKVISGATFCAGKNLCVD